VGAPRLALFLRSEDNDYQQRIREDALATGARLGFEVSVLSARNEAAVQREQIARVVEAAAEPGSAPAPAAILVSPVSGGLLVDLARAATGAGIGWIVLNREAPYLAELRDAHPAVAVFGVTPDQREIGRIQGRQVVRLVPGGGNVLYITGHGNTSSAALRLEGFREETYGRHLVVTLLDADWTFEGARQACARWLGRLGTAALPLGVCCAQNDSMALGAAEALAEAAQRLRAPTLAGVPLTGCDGSPAVGQRLVEQGRLRATVAVPSPAGPAIELLHRARAEPGFRPPLEITLPTASFPDVAALG
jgi:ABC-type sugar transport system substrate-binding protein